MILSYHHIAPPESIPSARELLEGWSLTVAPDIFEAQLLKLRAYGYQFGALADMVATINSNGWEDSRTLAVTIDDGWLDSFTYALPILKKHGVPATFFVTTGKDWRGLARPKCMDKEHLPELVASGMTIGGHSRTHPNLASIPFAEALDEVAGNKKDLEDLLGVPVSLFAYPFGAYSKSAVRAVRQARYSAACSGVGGAINSRGSLYWLYRDSVEKGMEALEAQMNAPVFRRKFKALKLNVRNRVIWSLRCFKKG